MRSTALTMPDAKRCPACLASSTLSSMAARARNAIEMQQSETRPAAARSESPRSSLALGRLSKRANLVVQTNLPAQHAEHQRRGQVAVCRGERIDGFAAQQIVGVRLPALDGHQNVEGALRAAGDFMRDGAACSSPLRCSGHAVSRAVCRAQRRFRAGTLPPCRRFLPSSCTSSNSSHVSSGAGGEEPVIFDATADPAAADARSRDWLLRALPCDGR